LKGREVASSARFGAFEKMKCIFSIAPMESLVKLPECFRTEKHSPNALSVGTGRCVCASGVLTVSGDIRVEYRTLSTGRRLDPVLASGVA